MILTPKNWGNFQHYKNRSPIWIKLHRELLNDYEFACLPVASRALAPMLWLLASEYEKGKISASVEELAFRFRTTPSEMIDALRPLIEKGFFTDASNSLAACYQDAIPEKRREEVEKRRDISTPSAPMLAMNGTATILPMPVVQKADPADFEKFWAAYPKRRGANPRKPACQLFEKAIKHGDAAEMITRGAQAYQAECRRDGIIDTSKVAQAQTWLRQERYSDYVQANGTTIITPAFDIRRHILS